MMNKLLLQLISRQHANTIKYLCAPTPSLTCLHRRFLESATAGGRTPGGKKPIEQKISLIGKNNEFLITTLQEAEKISKRRELKLIKVTNLDSKTQRPLYRLVEVGAALPEHEKHHKDDKKKTSFRGEKMLTINSTISENDLSSRLKNVGKWLTKNYEVACVVACIGNDHSKGDLIVKRLEEETLAIGKIVQKRSAAGNIRFRITPKISNDEPPKEQTPS